MVQEFLAPKVVIFYQSDWTLYLGDRFSNHKASSAIMQELAGATGIDPQALVAFRPVMKGAREKLQWASARVTTVEEDIAYSLFGIFGIHLPVIYGESKQNALGRLPQEIVAQSGDISALDWVQEWRCTGHTTVSSLQLTLSEHTFTYLLLLPLLRLAADPCRRATDLVLSSLLCSTVNTSI